MKLRGTRNKKGQVPGSKRLEVPEDVRDVHRRSVERELRPLSRLTEKCGEAAVPVQVRDFKHFDSVSEGEAPWADGPDNLSSGQESFAISRRGRWCAAHSSTLVLHACANLPHR